MNNRDSRRNRNYNNNNNNHNNYGYNQNNNRSGQTRNHVIPNEPPYTAYIGNAPDTMVQGDFEHHLFVGLKVKQVRLVRDRQTDRFRGFAYVDFEDADSLRSAIALDGTYVNDRPIRIDVASRPLGGNKSEGFRNKPNFESRNNYPRQASGYNNRSSDEYRQSRTSQSNDVNGEENGYADDYSSNNTNNSRKISNEKEPILTHQESDEVFVATDTSPVSDRHESFDDKPTTTTRQPTRNWADCPIDDSGVDTSPPPPPPRANQTSTSHYTDDFQTISRNKPNKPHSNQQQYSSSRSTRHGNRNYYNQTSPPYSQQFHTAPVPLHLPSNYHHNRSQMSHQNQNGKHLTSIQSNNSNETNTNISTENRPRLQLLPRSQTTSSITSDNKISTDKTSPRNTNIFGCGKPRDERDPKIIELNKHIEEVVEKEQNLQSPTTPNTPIDFTKPIRILSSKSQSSTDH